jgi:vacuolar-type H+-ATPase subunit H
MSFLPNETIFNLSILLFVILIILAFAGLLIAIYGFLSKWLTFLQRDKISGAEQVKQKAYDEATRVVDDARRRAMKIVADATTRAQTSLAAVEKLSVESKNMVSTELNNLVKNQADTLRSASQDLVKFYKDTLTKQKAESTHVLEEATHSIEEELKHEVDEFKEVLRKETVGTQKEVEAKIQAEYTKIEKELTAYKTRQLQMIDETIYDILHDVSKRVFGEALSMEDHQELVIKALVEAKENNVFS